MVHRLSTGLGALGCAVLLALACTDVSSGPLFPRDAGAIGGRGGSGGGGGSPGRLGATGGGGGQAGSEADRLDAGMTGGDAGCRADADCDDQNACTTDSCESGSCGHGFAALGTQCGSQAADAGDGQPVGCPVDIADSVPLTVHWSSVGRPDLIDGACDSQGTPDYALVFTPPTTGTYHFLATGLIDSTPYTGSDGVDGDAVMTFGEASCGVTPVEDNEPCNDDAASDTSDAQLDLMLAAQQTITVYLNELGQTGGGTGTLSVTLVP